ncbi:MAG TPA: GNAT family N-acetyltransferase [Roseiarcus sp.]|nr:GNAT family N-acetyltransferase [Roseiarcus sp.]
MRKAILAKEAAARERGADDRDRKPMDASRPGSVTIREGSLDDLDAIVKLECDSFPDDRVSRRALRYFLRAPHRPIVAAVIDGELAGYALLSLRKRARAARIYSFAVAAHFARRGIGLALLHALEKYALANRRTALRLEVRYDNAPAIALYEKFGFRQFGEHVDYYADGATALRFEKVLVADPKSKKNGAPDRRG